MPVVAFSVGEEELRGVDTKPLVGHLAAWNYFQSIKNPTNDEFIKKWSAYAKAKNIAGHKDKPLTNDPMEATYIGIHMWAQAVTKAKSTDTDKVIAAMAGQTFKAPSGIVSKMDEKNHHLHKSVFIGEIKADGQFNVVWKTPGPVVADPWSDYIPENKGKLNVPETKKVAAQVTRHPGAALARCAAVVLGLVLWLAGAGHGRGADAATGPGHRRRRQRRAHRRAERRGGRGRPGAGGLRAGAAGRRGEGRRRHAPSSCATARPSTPPRGAAATLPDDAEDVRQQQPHAARAGRRGGGAAAALARPRRARHAASPNCAARPTRASCR